MDGAIITNVIIAVCTVITTLIGVIAVLGKRFEKIDAKLEKIDRDITDMKVQMGKLETRVEERTLRVIHATGTQGTTG